MAALPKAPEGRPGPETPKAPEARAAGPSGSAVVEMAGGAPALVMTGEASGSAVVEMTGDASGFVMTGGASGRPVIQDPARLKSALIAAFRDRKGLLASGLEKSLPWEWAGERLLIPVRDTLGAELLKKDAPFIREALADAGGRPLPFEVVIREQASPGPPPEEKPELSPQAEMVLRLFRGTVVKIQ